MIFSLIPPKANGTLNVFISVNLFFLCSCLSDFSINFIPIEETVKKVNKSCIGREPLVERFTSFDAEFVVKPREDGTGNSYFRKAKFRGPDGKIFYLFDPAARAVLTRGETYTFKFPKEHPLHLSLTPDGTHSDGGVEFTDGVKNRTKTSFTFQVPDSPPSNIYLYCEYHPAMGMDLLLLPEIGPWAFVGFSQEFWWGNGKGEAPGGSRVYREIYWSIGGPSASRRMARLLDDYIKKRYSLVRYGSTQPCYNFKRTTVGYGWVIE